jgi:DNA primase
MESRVEALFVDLNRDALRFQELYYNERRHINALDGQRCAGLAETLQPRVVQGDGASELSEAAA